MRIGVDLRPLQRETRFRGIGIYLEHLLLAMAPLAKHHTFIFFVEKGLPVPKHVIKAFGDHELRTLAPYHLARVRFVRAVAPPSLPIKVSPADVDIVFEPDVNLGVPHGAPSVMVFYDIIPYLFRDDHIIARTKGVRKVKRVMASKLYWAQYRRFLQHYAKAAHIIAISESSLKDLQKYVPATAHIPSSAVPLGASQTLVGASKAIPGITAKDQFLLYVGGIDIRKNIVGLGKSFLSLKQKYPQLKLVMVGKEFQLRGLLSDIGWDKIAQADKTHSIITPGFVDIKQLNWLYQNATAFVFPSRYEGFGLPILEAMQMGCPVIAYNNSSLPEVAGKAALLVKDGAPLGPAIEKLLTNEPLRKRLGAAGKQQAAKFTWAKTAKQTLAVFEQAANPDV